MIESPLIQEMLSTTQQTTRHEDIIEVLESRLGTVPPDVASTIRLVSSQEKLRELIRFAARCQDFEAFRAKVVA
jgi:hypothetical protein